MTKKILIIFAILIIGFGGYFLLKAFYLTYTPPEISEEELPPPTETNKIIIEIKNLSFSPSNVEIKKGQIISWVNEDSVSHNIESGNFKSSEILKKGSLYELQFNNIGPFDYICGIHPFMKGKIIVRE